MVWNKWFKLEQLSCLQWDWRPNETLGSDRSVRVQSCQGLSCFIFSVLCCTLNAVPETKSLLTKSKLPLGIHLHPFKDLQAS